MTPESTAVARAFGPARNPAPPGEWLVDLVLARQIVRDWLVRHFPSIVAEAGGT